MGDDELVPGAITIYIPRRGDPAYGDDNFKFPLHLYLGKSVNLNKFTPLSWQFYSIHLNRIITVEDYNQIQRYVNVETLK